MFTTLVVTTITTTNTATLQTDTLKTESIEDYLWRSLLTDLTKQRLYFGKAWFS